VADTVSVELDPTVIEVGLAIMVTVGFVELEEPHPATSKTSEQVTAMTSEKVAISGRRARTITMMGNLLFR
jgi:hypothetical protein